MPEKLTLLPAPRHLQFLEGTFILSQDRLILLDSPEPQNQRFSASRCQKVLQEHLGLKWETVASQVTPAELVGLTLHLSPNTEFHPQGYELSITPQGIKIEACDDPGLFYGICTLNQILLSTAHNRQAALPCLHISDYPDFPVRGVMLDISRDKVPTMETTLSLVDLLSSWKINQLQLYMEHTFAYRRHPMVWAEASPFTGEEIMELDAFCRQRHIELVPNQNSFGHMHRWLKHPPYRHLAEAPDGFDLPWGTHQDGPFSLYPLDPGSLELVRSLYDELLPHFTSRMFNAGFDETFDLGQGRSKAECERIGTGRVYLDFLLKVYREVTQRGYTFQFWGDIIIGHPDLVHELPKDAIALEWGYEADHPFDEHGASFAAAGLPFYVCPGTSSWTSIAGRTDNTIGNLYNAAHNGLKHGAIGYLITDWGDDGHWQTLPVSYLGFAVGAAFSWALEANHEMDIVRALSLYAFEDPTGNMAQAAYDLGNVYQIASEGGFPPINSSVLFWILQSSLASMQEPPSSDLGSQFITATNHAQAAIDHAHQLLKGSASARSDASLLRREFNLTVHMLQHACQRRLLACGDLDIPIDKLSQDLGQIIHEYQSIWLERNRPGGLKDSLAHFQTAIKDYQ
jgi:hexosaminidase